MIGKSGHIVAKNVLFGCFFRILGKATFASAELVYDATESPHVSLLVVGLSF